MTEFTFHDQKSAPEKSKLILKKLLAESGPNSFYSILAESPEALASYIALHKAFSATSFSNEERTVIWQVINVENECHFCVPAHTKMAKLMNISDKLINALRNETSLSNDKLESLRDFTLILLRKRGHASNEEILLFLKSGYTKKNILEIVVGIAQKTISNYINHLTKPPIDEQYKKYSWVKAG